VLPSGGPCKEAADDGGNHGVAVHTGWRVLLTGRLHEPLCEFVGHV